MRDRGNTMSCRIYGIYHLDCYKNTGNYKRHHIPSSPKEINGYDVLSKAEQEGIVKSLWPYQVEKELRSKLNFTQSIDVMTAEELRVEAEKRGVEQYVKDADWSDYRDEGYLIKTITERLRNYLNTEECKRVYDLLVVGYCKEIIAETKLNIPSYLQKYIVKFYPPVLYKRN